MRQQKCNEKCRAWGVLNSTTSCNLELGQKRLSPWDIGPVKRCPKPKTYRAFDLLKKRLEEKLTCVGCGKKCNPNLDLSDIDRKNDECVCLECINKFMRLITKYQRDPTREEWENDKKK